MMSYTTQADHNTDAYKKLGEFFTPPGVVFPMILNGGIRESIQDVDKTMFDPCVGEGQFPCAELVMKMFYAIDKLDENTAVRALASLYGVDIQASSVLKTKQHLLQTLYDAFEFFTGKKPDAEYFSLEACAFLNDNIIEGDSLKLMKKWANPRQSLFD